MIDKKQWVLDKYSIVKTAQNYGLKPKRNGSNKWFVCCPVHNENTPSCCLFENDNSFKCFGCGAHGNIIDFVMALEGSDFSQTIQRLYGGIEDFTPRPLPTIPLPPPVPQKFIDRKEILSNLITRENYEQNVFANWLVRYFSRMKDDNGNEISKERILTTLRNFGVVSRKNKSEIGFPFIDTQKNVCNIKYLSYHETISEVAFEDCKRIKETVPYNFGTQAKGYLFSCLFGSHLIKPTDIVGVVESEKTAIIASLYYPNITFVATGGKTAFGKRIEMLTTLENEIRFYPDYDDHEQDRVFLRKVESLQEIGRNAKYISNYFEKLPNEQMRKKADLADYIVHLGVYC